MPRPERALDPDAGPVELFAFRLRQLRREAGHPSYRDLARAAHYSPATLAAAAGGRRLPSLPVVLGYVRACNGDEAVWRARWLAARAETGSPSVEDTTELPPDAVTHDRVAVSAGRRRRVLVIALPVVILLAVSVAVLVLRVDERRAAPGGDRTELIGIDHFGDGVVRAWPNTGGFPGWPWAGPVGLNSGWTEPDRARFADLDGDGYDELIAINTDGTISASKNNRRFPAWPWHPAVEIGREWDRDPDVIQFADLNGDRRAELVATTGAGDATMRVWPNNGRFPEWPWGTEVSASPAWTAPERVRFADLDGDGMAELVGMDDGTIEAWPNNGRFPAWPWEDPVGPHSSWTDPSVNTGWTDPDRVRFADLNGDNRDELIAIVPDGTITAAENNRRFPDWPWHTSVEIGRGWDDDPDVIQFANLDGTR